MILNSFFHLKTSKMNYHALFLLILQILCTWGQDPPTTGQPDPQHEWEILIFTQRWPLTACSQWEEANKNNTCAFPDPQDLWTIHGIWPTKPGTKGPQNCNSTWHFNDTQIDPIKNQLEEYWTNVEKNTKLDSLWKHEWTKHGTCAAVLPQLNNELNYFKQGLDWIKEFNMKNVLSQQKVTPNDQGYSVQQIFDSVKLVLNKSPVIQCVVDRKSKLSLLSEIRICFNKSLDLMDCDTVKDGDFVRVGDVLTNCNIKKSVMYPNKVTPYTTSTTTVPTTATRVPSTKITTTVSSIDMTIPETITTMSTLESLYNTRECLITFYRTVKLLIWATI